jgi:hypothetical protein
MLRLMNSVEFKVFFLGITVHGLATIVIKDTRHVTHQAAGNIFEFEDESKSQLVATNAAVFLDAEDCFILQPTIGPVFWLRSCLMWLERLLLRVLLKQEEESEMTL